jgi:hypothetical protein
MPHTLRGQRVDVSTVDDRIEIWHQDLRSPSIGLPPGGTSILDEHYDRPSRKPRRAVRPRTSAEKDFLALGKEAVAFLRAAAAAGTTRLRAHIADIAALRAAHGAEALTAALRRAVEFRRFTAEDVRAILAAGPAARGDLGQLGHVRARSSGSRGRPTSARRSNTSWSRAAWPFSPLTRESTPPRFQVSRRARHRSVRRPRR